MTETTETTEIPRPAAPRWPASGPALFRRAVVTAATLASLAALATLAAAPALAQPANRDAGELHDVAIAPGPLNEVLARYAAAVGVQLVFSPQELAGLQSPGLQGRQEVGAGFRQLLAGSGFEVVDQGGQVFALRRVARPSPATSALPAAGGGGAAAAHRQLAEVRVTGQSIRDTLTEGTRSYAAQKTSASTGLHLTPRETPQSVTVVTRQRMDDQGLVSLGDVVEQVTGVATQGIGGGPSASYTTVFSRGYQVQEMMIDGMLVPMSLFSGGAWEGWNDLDTSLYDSVSFVRGANGLMTGSGEPGGTIVLTRKRPTDTFQGSASLSLGRWHQRRLVADVGGPMNEAGTLRGRLVAVYGEGNSWLDRYAGYESTLYGIVEADLGSRSRVSLSLEHGRNTGVAGGPYNGFATAFTDGSPTPFVRGNNSYAGWSRNRARRAVATLALDHRFNDDWTAKVQYINGRGSNDRKFGNITAIPDLDGLTNVMVRRIGSWNQADAFAASLEGRYRLWQREHQLVVGVNGYSSREKDRPTNGDDRAYERYQTFNFDGTYPEPDWSTVEAWDQTRYRTEQVGLFINNRLKVLDSLALITGARFSNWKTRAASVETGDVSDDRKENGVFTPYAALVYDLTRNLSVYGSYTSNFTPQSNEDQSGRRLDPERGKSFELGLKGAWFDNRLNASAAVFEIRKDNLAVLDGGLTPSGDDSYAAVDNTKGRGWEVEVSGELLPGWSLQAGYGRAVIRDSDGVRLTTDIPKHVFKLFTTWTPRSMSNLTVGGGLQWQSKAWWPDDNGQQVGPSTIKGYTVVNLMGRYRINPNLSLSLNLYNLFDERYRVDTTTHDYGSPRTLMTTLRYQF